MERIIRLNAVEISSEGESSGMKQNDFHPQNHFALKKVSTAVTALETPTNYQHTRWVGELLRWREQVRDWVNSMHKSEAKGFPI
ncbi:hypothetical protein NIES2100_61060 [Calothrix sp. NIES-2100]|uniref:hypothetical protein n=1 Tax=Calothrix sp. NIES-2100 TaxID=1954172 RepID=UPI000B5F230E|nr:hypothetical protein NIES2100_61060 [Calothrix sp. NIES-2100]